MTRRSLLHSSFAASLAAAATPAPAAAQSAKKAKYKQAITRGVLRKMDFEAACKMAADNGVKGFDLVGEKDYPILKKYGLVPSMVPGGSGLRDGINHLDQHARIEPLMRQAIDWAASVGAPNVIVLSGERKGIEDWRGLDNCVTFYNKIKAQAEDKQVTLAMELLNSKVNHPDYQCDRTWWGIEVCKRVASPRVRLLYDIYHMQIMEGDVIRTIREQHQWFAHYHTAGNPGRHELNDQQELFYPAIARAIAETGVTGFVAHEYTPLGDPEAGLKQAMQAFDV